MVHPFLYSWVYITCKANCKWTDFLPPPPPLFIINNAYENKKIDLWWLTFNTLILSESKNMPYFFICVSNFHFLGNFSIYLMNIYRVSHITWAVDLQPWKLLQKFVHFVTFCYNCSLLLLQLFWNNCNKYCCQILIKILEIFFMEIKIKW